MKKLLSIILVVGIFMSVLCINAGAAELTPVQISEQKLRKADINSNGTYDLDDVQKLLRVAAGIEADNIEKFDVDGDGYTSVQDAVLVLRQAAGTGSVLTDEEALALFNAKLNAVKTDKPGFTCVSTAQCTSMKVTQKITASGGLLSGLLNGMLKEMNYTDLEYDKYVERMVAQLEKSKNNSSLTAADKKEIEEQIAALEKSGETYKDVEYAEKTIAQGDVNGHRSYFPRAGETTLASALSKADIKNIKFNLVKGEIIFTVTMGDTSYTNTTYPKTSGALSDISYGKVFNLPYLRGETGSVLTKAEYKNGMVQVALDAQTAEIKSATYSYNYYSDVKAPKRSMTESGNTLSVEMSTKMSGTITETVTF